MTQIILNVSDELARELKAHEGEIAGILESGLRHWQAGQEPVYSGFEDAMARLATARTADEILCLRPGPQLAARVAELLEKCKSASLTDSEQSEWDRYELLEHVIRLAKARAVLKRPSQG